MKIFSTQDIDHLSVKWGPGINGHAAGPAHNPPVIFSAADLHRMDFPKAEFLVENMLPERGASLIIGVAKSGKTLLASQIGIAVAQGAALFDNYRVLKQGGVLIVEQDDPGGAGSVKAILVASGAPKDLALHVAPHLPFGFGPELLEWLEQQVRALALRLVILDSYTALRGPRAKGIDIVKAEQSELRELDELAKRVGCAVAIIHHGSKGASGLDWSAQAGGTYAMTAATEGQIHISRFSEFDGSAPERLVHVRVRHGADLALVLRFRPNTLNYEFVLDGSGAEFYPLLLQIKSDFGAKPFGPKELAHATGASRATANRHIQRLLRSDVLRKCGYGEYTLTLAVSQ